MSITSFYGPPEWWLKQHRKAERYNQRAANSERNREMVRLRQEEGLTYRAIGERYGVSRQRVHRIVSGLTLVLLLVGCDPCTPSESGTIVHADGSATSSIVICGD